MIHVSSSNIEAVGYDETSEELDIEFKGGAVYRYTGVRPDVYDNLMKAPSVGKFFINNIKEDYPCKKL